MPTRSGGDCPHRSVAQRRAGGRAAASTDLRAATGNRSKAQTAFRQNGIGKAFSNWRSSQRKKPAPSSAWIRRWRSRVGRDLVGFILFVHGRTRDDRVGANPGTVSESQAHHMDKDYLHA